jgi:hypothetical protein
MSSAARFTPMSSVYAGQRCIGFILSRGRDGYEAFSAEQKSLGLFQTKNDAADAVVREAPQ